MFKINNSYRCHPPKSSKSQETVAKSSSKIQAKVSKSSFKAKPLSKVSKVSKSLPKNAFKSLQINSLKKSSLYYYKEEDEDEDEDENKDEDDVEISKNQRNIQNDDNDNNNNASPSPKSSRNQNQRSVTFKDKVDNSSISHIAANILEMLSEDNIEDNDNNDDRQLMIYMMIIILANQMYMASSSSIENIGTFNKSSMPSSAISPRIINNRDDARIWDEEIKNVSFLEQDFPQQHVLMNLLRKYWHKLNQTVLGYIKNYKAIQERFIGGTNQRELQRSGTVKKLVQLICEMFKIHWQCKNIDQVKTLDNLTKNMHVPSRSGLDIASKLNFN
ncbi:hypothetical protein C2G38_2200801 [Gigaspora rosea]|uniref:Uncharacterized protein n=1 Tax=Gigaspora rosea TaxID=44941 RepID=A0A397UUI1_9GLOM|nr:hypothetical protein C2G38_2200801 [Gigaspora rosea]